MNDKEKAKEIAGYKSDEKPEIPMFQGQDGDKYACYESAMAMAQWKDEKTKQLHEIIIKLWDILDWIDTYADLKINGSENDVYFGKIENKTKERFAFVKSDGYDLFINNEKITNNEHNTKTD